MSTQGFDHPSNRQREWYVESDEGANVLRRTTPPPAISAPAPPARASTRLSVASWRISRFRSAPIASRTPISRVRALARPSTRLATLPRDREQHERQDTQQANQQWLIGIAIDAALQFGEDGRREGTIRLRITRRESGKDCCRLGTGRFLVTPGFKRPLTVSVRRPRSASCVSSLAPSRTGVIISGTKNVGRARSKRPSKESGTTPTTSKSAPLSRTRLQ